MHLRPFLSFLQIQFVCSSLATNWPLADADAVTSIRTRSDPIPIDVWGNVIIDAAEGQTLIIMEFDDLLSRAAGPFNGTLRSGPRDDIHDDTPPNALLLFLPNSINNKALIDRPENYSTACADLSSIFNSSLTFLNCLQLSFASLLLDNKIISLDQQSLDNMDRALHTGDFTKFDGKGVMQNITTCISQTCQNTSDFTCSQAVHESLETAKENIDDVTNYLPNVYEALSHYCDLEAPQINSDVLGPGVLIAFLSQFSAVAFLYLVSTIHRVIQQVRKRPGRLFANDTPLDPNQAPDRLTRVIKRTPPAVNAVIIDFHEAQTLFVLTIQIATLWFFSPAKVIRTSKTFAEAISNNLWAIFITLISLAPVLLMQSILQRSRRHWWWTTLLTSVVSILAWYSNNQLLYVDYAALWTELQSPENSGAQCGGKPAPITYCSLSSAPNISEGLVDRRILHVAGQKQLINIYFIAIYWAPAFLFIDQFLVSRRSQRYRDYILSFFTKITRWNHWSDHVKVSVSRSSNFAIHLIWILHQGLLFVSLTWGFFYLLYIYNGFGLAESKWTYGQLIAALIWVPLGLKLFYFIIFGVKRGVENRVGDQYELISQTSITTASLVTQTITTETNFAKHGAPAARYTNVPDAGNYQYDGFGGLPRQDSYSSTLGAQFPLQTHFPRQDSYSSTLGAQSPPQIYLPRQNFHSTSYGEQYPSHY
ncbi:hypothetical protein F4680DRAFT_470838 [Xylaria scruposa]|nr:hypothetical protein F4680DRAFT_470838 [Xylaria scruposa]